MQRGFSFSLLAIGLLLVAGTSCKKDFGDLNISPNAPATPSTKFLFGNAVINLGGPFGVGVAAGNLYVQHMAEYQYSEESRYFNRIYTYDPLYAGPLMDVQTVINLNTDPETRSTRAVLDNGTNANQLGHARILKAFLMLHVTDRWGDVPYTEAFKGPANNKPKFDSQRSIYNDLLKELKEAAAQITDGLPNDPLFDGDADRWIKWAHSLRAIIALRMSGTEDAAIARAAFTEAVADGVIASNTENAIYQYLANINFECPWFTNYARQGRYDYGVSNTITDFMNANNDPRKVVFARPAISTGTFQGIPYGDDESYNVVDYSLLGRAVYAQNAQLQLTTYAQMCFTMAEAALIGWIAGGDAQVAAWYELGINASMDQWAKISVNPVVSFSTTDKNNYRQQPAIDIPVVNTLTASQKLERIQTQKWLNFYMNNGFESWAEWRRTGYPVLQPALDPLSSDGEIPRRQCYPTTEKDLNGANYAAALTAQGPDELSTRMWWDK